MDACPFPPGPSSSPSSAPPSSAAPAPPPRPGPPPAAGAAAPAGAQARAGEDFPRSGAAFSRLVAVEELDLRRDADGATAVRLALRLRPDGIRAEAPRYASFLEKYGTPIRARARAEGVSGRAGGRGGGA